MSPVGECIPYYEPGARVTVQATATVHAGRALTIQAAKANGAVVTVAESGADTEAIIGVAGVDIATGKKGVAYLVSSGYVIPMVSSAGITAGQFVHIAAGGKIVSGAKAAAIGIAWTTATGADQDVMVQIV